MYANNCVLNRFKSPDSTLQDYCDGSVFNNHPLFATHTSALQILLYFDDVEVCNPLASKTKTHKLSFFYFNLGNLSPKLRSKLPGIQLLAVVRHKLLNKYGMDAILSLTLPVHIRTCRVSPSRPIMILPYNIDNFFITS